MDYNATSATISRALADQVRALAHRPLLTAYDESTGARTELSYATAANWAAKTANLLVEEFDAGVGTTAALDLDGHWTTVPVALACWQAGVRTAPARRGTGAAADIAVCHTSRLGDHPEGVVIAVGDGLRAEPLDPIPPRDGLVLLGEDVHVYADDFDDGGDVTPGTPALLAESIELDHAALLQQAARLGDELDGSQRVGVVPPLDSAAALVTLAYVVHAGASLVSTRSAGRPQWDRWSTENVTAVVSDPGHRAQAAERGLRFVAASELLARRP